MKSVRWRFRLLKSSVKPLQWQSNTGRDPHFGVCFGSGNVFQQCELQPPPPNQSQPQRRDVSDAKGDTARMLHAAGHFPATNCSQPSRTGHPCKRRPGSEPAMSSHLDYYLSLQVWRNGPSQSAASCRPTIRVLYPAGERQLQACAFILGMPPGDDTHQGHLVPLAEPDLRWQVDPRRNSDSPNGRCTFFGFTAGT